MAINFNTRENLATIGAVVVAGIALAITTVIGIPESIAIIRSIISPRQTNVDLIASPARPGEEILANEQVLLSLDGVESERVYWLLDEGEKALKGGVQLQYVFNFDPENSIGIRHFRRVDAFYKKDGQYETVTKRVPVINLRIDSSAEITSDQLKLNADSELGNEWQLSGASLANYVDGKFDVVENIPVDSASASKETSQYTWELKDAAKALGYESEEDLKQKILAEDKVWFSIGYKSKVDNQKLSIVQPFLP